MCIYQNDYQPLESAARFAEEAKTDDDWQPDAWTCPFVNEPNSRWDLTSEGPAVLLLNEEDSAEHRLKFVAPNGNTFRTTYAYNDNYMNMNNPVCSDLMIRFRAQPLSEGCWIGGRLEIDGILYEGRFDFFGRLMLAKRPLRDHA